MVGICLRCVGGISRTMLVQCGHVPDIMQISNFVPDVYRTYKMGPGCVGDKAGTCLERLVGVPFILI